MSYNTKGKKRSYNSNYYIKNKEKIQLQQKQYYIKNKEKKKQYYIKNKKQKRKLQKQLLCEICARNTIDLLRSIHFCSNCLDKHCIYQRTSAEKYQELNICLSCHKNPIDNIRSKWYCSFCLDKRNYNKKVNKGHNPSFFPDLLLIKEVLDGRNKN